MRGVNAVVLVPVKAFADAKARLRTVLDDSQREQLARWTGARVLAAAGELPTYVACDDASVAEWAAGHGATVLWHPGVGLNAAVNDSIDELGAAGVSDVIIAHGDLARATRLAALVAPHTITLVPDRHDDGTNVVAMPTSSVFRVAYGPGSFHRHLDAAIRSGLRVRVRRHPLLAVDIDTPSDLAHPLVQEVLPTWLPTIPANHR
jgi:2-phospho-L-lactate/phosphoenolpyruvate guanylyltransferase